MRVLSKLFFMAFIAVAVAGCNSGSDSSDPLNRDGAGGGGGIDGGTGDGAGGDGSSDDGDDVTDGDGGDVTQAESIRLGSVNASGVFVEGELRIGLSELSAGGTSSVVANARTPDGFPVTEAVEVNFSSTCQQQGLAEIDSPATVVNGRVSVSYRATGCNGDDVINAVVFADGAPVAQASGTITVQSAVLGSISFVGANPGYIALKGLGRDSMPERSTVTFRVEDTNGNPISGRQVAFSLNEAALAGGIALSRTSDVSNADGLISTDVSSGDQPTSIIITASTDTGITTQSNELLASSGVPNQGRLSLSADRLNPEAFSCDGVQVELTMRVADYYGNPVPDGTAISFITDKGTVEGGCNAEGGGCSVTWTSNGPRGNGRATVLAYTLGEEAFVDDNANGRFTNGNSFTDLPDAWLDSDETGAFTNGEVFIDLKNTGAYSAGDGIYNGILCDEQGGCDKWGRVHVRDATVLVMAGSGALFTNLGGVVNGEIDLSMGSVTYEVGITDTFGRQMPAGTTVSAEVFDQGSIVGVSSYDWPSTNALGGLAFGFTIKPGNDPGTGLLVLTVTSPGDACGPLTTSYSVPIQQ